MTGWETTAGIGALAAALAFVGRTLIVGFTRNIDRQMDIAEKQQEILATTMAEQTRNLADVTAITRTHCEMTLENHRKQNLILDEMLVRARKLNGNHSHPTAHSEEVR